MIARPLVLALLLLLVGGVLLLPRFGPAVAAEEGTPSTELPAPAAAEEPLQPLEEDGIVEQDEVGESDGSDEAEEGEVADEGSVPPEDEDDQPEDEPATPTGSAPAVRSSTIPPASILLAVGVLLLGAVGVGRLLRPRPARAAWQPGPRGPSGPAATDGSEAAVAGPSPAAPLAPTGPATPLAPTGPATPRRAPQPVAPLSAAGQATTPLPGGDVAPASDQLAAEAVVAPGRDRVDRGTLDLLLEVGRALIDSGDAVSHVQDVLERIAAVNGAAHVGIIVLPTALIVSIPGGDTVETEVAPAGRQRLRLDQVEAVVRVASAAEEGVLGPADGIAAIDAARQLPPPSSDRTRIWGYVLFTVGLAMILRGGLLELVVAAGLGVAIGALQFSAERLRASYQAFLPVVLAFVAAAVVFGLGRLVSDLAVFPPLVAPLVALLPGAVLTTAVFELSTGHVISGSGRLAAGMLRLVLLALGIVAAAELLGVPAAQVSEGVGGAVGVLEPWLGVAVFGVGVVVFNGVRRASLPWILLVLFLAYAGQVLGGLFFGATLSAFFGALVMTPVAMIAATQPTGPPALVSFLPGFWLLVPGALGLAGITSILDEDRLEGIASLTTMGTSMIGIALGVLLGMAVGSELTTRLSLTVPMRGPTAAD